MTFQIDIRAPKIIEGKILIELQEINYSYTNALLWSNPLTFQGYSGERIHIVGSNGSGKTTLLQIITGKLEPINGYIKRKAFTSLYIDQSYTIIKNSLTLIEQVQCFNERHLPEHEVNMLLHYHQFSKETWNHPCKYLSGGEKIKLMFCCVAISNQTPDILLLDEPTNNLDLYGQDILTEAILNFKGTLLVISHDETFIKNIQINKSIRLN